MNTVCRSLRVRTGGLRFAAHHLAVALVTGGFALLGTAADVAAQSASATQGGTAGGPPAPVAVPGAIVPPEGYVIGPEDVLGVLFWREKDMSADVSVRPDGKITLPLLNDVDAAGLKPEELRQRITEASIKFVADPSVTVVVKEIRSRKVFITGLVAKPGQYPLTGPTTVMQLIAMAGGLQEFADGKQIIIMRMEAGRQVAHRFNYKDVLNRKNLRQNIDLKPGDTVVVP